MSVGQTLSKALEGIKFITQQPMRLLGFALTSTQSAFTHLANGIKTFQNGRLGFIVKPIFYLTSTMHKVALHASWTFNSNAHLITQNAAYDGRTINPTYQSDALTCLEKRINDVPIEIRAETIEIMSLIIKENSFTNADRDEIFELLVGIPREKRKECFTIAQWAFRNLGNLKLDTGADRQQTTPRGVFYSLNSMQHVQRTAFLMAIQNPNHPFQLLRGHDLTQIRFALVRWSNLDPKQLIEAEAIIAAVIEGMDDDATDLAKEQQLEQVLASIEFLVMMKKDSEEEISDDELKDFFDMRFESGVEFDHERIGEFLGALSLLKFDKTSLLDLYTKATFLNKIPKEKQPEFAQALSTHFNNAKYGVNEIAQIAFMTTLSSVNVVSYSEYLFQLNKLIDSHIKGTEKISDKAVNILATIYFDEFDSQETNDFIRLVIEFTNKHGRHFDEQYLLKEISKKNSNREKLLIIQGFFKYYPELEGNTTFSVDEICTFPLRTLEYLSSPQAAKLYQLGKFENLSYFLDLVKPWGAIEQGKPGENGPVYKILHQFIAKYPDAIHKSNFALWLTYVPSEHYLKISQLIDSIKIDDEKFFKTQVLIDKILEEDPNIKNDMESLIEANLGDPGKSKQTKWDFYVSLTKMPIKEDLKKALVLTQEELY